MQRVTLKINVKHIKGC